MVAAMSILFCLGAQACQEVRILDFFIDNSVMADWSLAAMGNSEPRPPSQICRSSLLFVEELGFKNHAELCI